MLMLTGIVLLCFYFYTLTFHCYEINTRYIHLYLYIFELCNNKLIYIKIVVQNMHSEFYFLRHLCSLAPGVFVKWNVSDS